MFKFIILKKNQESLLIIIKTHNHQDNKLKIHDCLNTNNPIFIKKITQTLMYFSIIHNRKEHTVLE